MQGALRENIYPYIKYFPNPYVKEIENIIT